MQCLLVAATAAEIEPVMRHFKNNVTGTPVPDILVTGIGMLATTWQLAKCISLKRPGLIVQAGIAGCFDAGTPLAKVFIVKTEMLADLGVHEKGQWRDVFDMGLSRSSGFPFVKKELKNPHKELLKKINLLQARSITINSISSGKKQVAERFKLYNPLLESMEGAALHYVALQENIPFVQLRSLSNYAGERNKKNWQIAPAIEALNKELLRIFNIL